MDPGGKLLALLGQHSSLSGLSGWTSGGISSLNSCQVLEGAAQEVAESPSLGVFRKHLDVALGALGLELMTLEVFSSLSGSVILPGSWHCRCEERGDQILLCAEGCKHTGKNSSFAGEGTGVAILG